MSSSPDESVLGAARRTFESCDYLILDSLTQSNTNETDCKMSIGQAQLSKYELGLSVPTLEVLLKLKAHSGKSVDWIITGQDN